MSRYEMEGGSALYGENFELELNAAIEAGLVVPEGDGWRKIDFFDDYDLVV